jgi:hypothetical protein
MESYNVRRRSLEGVKQAVDGGGGVEDDIESALADEVGVGLVGISSQPIAMCLLPLCR